MNKLVYSVFKTIAFAMIFVFVWDMVFYMYRVSSLNQRVESMMTSLQKVVMENNCLPIEDSELYKQLLVGLAEDFNGGEAFANDGTGEFIMNIGWNVGTDAVDSNGVSLKTSSPLSVTGTRDTYTNHSWTSRNVELLHYQMDEVGAYGDVQTVQVRVRVRQPMWGFGRGSDTSLSYNAGGTNDGVAEGGEYGAANWQNRTSRNPNGASAILSYTYYVPCLKYKSVTQ